METFARFLLETMLTAGWRVTVALCGRNIFTAAADRFGERLTIEPVDWLDGTCKGDREYFPRRILDRQRWFHRCRPDAAVFVQSFNTPFRASITGAALAGVPVVITHRTMPYPLPQVASRRHLWGLLPGLGLHRRRTVFKTWLTSALAARVVYNSAQVRAGYERQYHYPQSKGVVIPNAVIVPDKPEPAGRRAGLEPIIIGYVGRLHVSKGVDVLLQATALLRRQHAVRLLICGEGPHRDDLVALAGQLGLGALIEWVDPVEDVWPVYDRCDIIALPSRRESSSNMILEAMSLGKPVVVSRVGGLPELVAQGRAGVIVEPDNAAALAEALVALIGNRQERAALGARAQETARRLHDPATIGRAWRELLEQVVLKGIRPRRLAEVAAMLRSSDSAPVEVVH
jgi:glycosyltransferase involved in cell wall biosynthesis